MKILFLGYSDSSLIDFLKNSGEEVIVSEEKIDSSFIQTNKIELIISYGYTHIIQKNVLETLPGKVINLHISYLPYNKGSDPNFWSFIDDTPKGLTIHLVNEGLDTGDIILQEQVELSDSDNLKSTYFMLQQAIQALFMKNWKDIKQNKVKPQHQLENGTVHKSIEKEQYISGIKEKWLDLPINELIAYVGEVQLSRQFFDAYYEEVNGN